MKKNFFTSGIGLIMVLMVAFAFLIVGSTVMAANINIQETGALQLDGQVLVVATDSNAQSLYVVAIEKADEAMTRHNSNAFKRSLVVTAYEATYYTYTKDAIAKISFLRPAPKTDLTEQRSFPLKILS